MSDSKQTSSYKTMIQQEDHQEQDQLQAQDTHETVPEGSEELLKKPHAKASKCSIQAQEDSTIEQLKAVIQEKEKEISDLKLRNLADINNLQERYRRESATLKTYAHQYLAKDILDVVDALEQAQNSLEGQQKAGIQLISDMLQKTFDKHSIETIDPTGKLYDHRNHEAMVMQPSETTENNHVIQVIQKGYKIRDRLLRPARVIVAKNDKTS